MLCLIDLLQLGLLVDSFIRNSNIVIISFNFFLKAGICDQKPAMYGVYLESTNKRRKLQGQMEHWMIDHIDYLSDIFLSNNEYIYSHKKVDIEKLTCLIVKHLWRLRAHGKDADEKKFLRLVEISNGSYHIMLHEMLLI